MTSNSCAGFEYILCKGMAPFHLTVALGNSINEEIYLNTFFKLLLVLVITHGGAELSYLSRPISSLYDQQRFHQYLRLGQPRYIHASLCMFCTKFIP